MSIKLLPANRLETLTKFSTNSCNRSVLNVFHVRCAAQTFDRPSYVVGRYHFGGKDIMDGGLYYSEPYYSDPNYIKPYYIEPYYSSEPYYSGLAYLIFVICFTRAKFLENIIYTEKARKLRQNTQ